MAPSKDIVKRNRLSLLDKVKMILVMLPMPILLIWSLISAPFSPYGRAKSWKRICADRVILRVVTMMNRRQVRAIFGTTRAIYDDFVKAKGEAQDVEDIGENAKILWVGPKTERVLLYLHGGALLLAMTPSAPSFWNYIQENTTKRGKPISIAILNYTLVPDALFPAQLQQSVLAIQHLLKKGIKPENIVLVGDSAGGLLIHAVLSHLLHPLEGIPELNLSTPLGGAFMLSPWVRLVDNLEDRYLYKNEGRGDCLDARSISYWGGKVLDDVLPSVVPYLEANSAPEDWLKGIDRYVNRVLITSGGLETLRDEIIKYGQLFQKYHGKSTLVLDETGVHNDPYMDFFVGEKKSGKLTPIVADFIYDCFP